MIRTTRRSLLAAPALPLLAMKFTRPLGVQLYTVRTLMPKDARGTLAAIASMGYVFVEPGRGQLAQLEPHLKELKLATPSVGLELPLVTGAAMPAGGPQSLADAIGPLPEKGVRFAVIAYVGRPQRDEPGFYDRFAEQMNRAGEECRKRGVQLCYHHHSFEFDPAGGRRPFDLLVEKFDPKAVHFELDTFWLKIAGEDPARMLRRLKGRVSLIHLKDIARGTAVEYNEGKVAREAFKEVGNGELNWPDILKACEEAGVKHYIVEQDWWPGDPLDSLKQSIRYLRGLA
ncbi:MAG: sugar phosphate isomerase/epimerase [Bryobacteraceae bacterium]|nr:sugar phosphate isomerase/epimerase [Bryobacteraceae bacterium]